VIPLFFDNSSPVHSGKIVPRMIFALRRQGFTFANQIPERGIPALLAETPPRAADRLFVLGTHWRRPEVCPTWALQGFLQAGGDQAARLLIQSKERAQRPSLTAPTRVHSSPSQLTNVSIPPLFDFPSEVERRVGDLQQRVDAFFLYIFNPPQVWKRKSDLSRPSPPTCSSPTSSPQ